MTIINSTEFVWLKIQRNFKKKMSSRSRGRSLKRNQSNNSTTYNSKSDGNPGPKRTRSRTVSKEFCSQGHESPSQQNKGKHKRGIAKARTPKGQQSARRRKNKNTSILQNSEQIVELPLGTTQQITAEIHDNRSSFDDETPPIDDLNQHQVLGPVLEVGVNPEEEQELIAMDDEYDYPSDEDSYVAEGAQNSEENPIEE